MASTNVSGPGDPADRFDMEAESFSSGPHQPGDPLVSGQTDLAEISSKPAGSAELANAMSAVA